MGEELSVPWHTFDCWNPIIALPTGGVLLSLMVSSHDCADVYYLTTEVVWLTACSDCSGGGDVAPVGRIIGGGSGPSDGFLFW
jgi:hypothetical protein